MNPLLGTGCPSISTTLALARSRRATRLDGRCTVIAIFCSERDRSLSFLRIVTSTTSSAGCLRDMYRPLRLAAWVDGALRCRRTFPRGYSSTVEPVKFGGRPSPPGILACSVPERERFLGAGRLFYGRSISRTLVMRWPENERCWTSGEASPPPGPTNPGGIGRSAPTSWDQNRSCRSREDRGRLASGE